ncbi:MAG: hypothetical protein IT200_15560 [Thermoleophilia bacterium]|nr:hypothetical protein [Thermoleophilia bacterium]
MIVPPPPPAYTLSPALEDLDEDTIAVIERCVAALTGQVGAVVVIGVGATEQHVVIELATAVGPVLLLELMDTRPLPVDSSPEGI